MKLKTEALRKLKDPALSPDERARRRLQLSKKFEDAGDFESAREALGDLWRGVGARPQLEGLKDEQTIGEVLLRVGALTGWIGSSQQIEEAQAQAKDLLSESTGVFERLGMSNHAAEAQTELAYCYWREGAFDEARVILRAVLSRLGEDEKDRRAVAVLRLAIVETSTPGAIAPPRNSPLAETTSTQIEDPKSTTIAAVPYLWKAARQLTMRSAPTSLGLS